MRNLLVALTGFLVGAGLIAAVAFAVPQGTTSANTPVAQAVTTSGGMMGSMPMMSSRTVHLTIQHVQRGCHVWANGNTTGTMMRLHLKQGQHLAIMDMDVDAHQMMQFSGPAHLRMGGPMMMNHGLTMTFTKKGIYRLGTHTVEMPGGLDVKTIGPDNKLRLMVTVP